MADRPEISVTIAGAVGVGKSAIALTILDALRAAGLQADWNDENSERNLGSGADDVAALDPRPVVRLVETIAQQPAAADAEDPAMVADYAAALASTPRPSDPFAPEPGEDAMVDATDDPDAMAETLASIAEALGCACDRDTLLHAVDQLTRDVQDAELQRERREQVEARATDIMRMLWLVVHQAGGTATVPMRAMLSTDWSTCGLGRSDNLATGDVELVAQVRGETAKPRTTQHQALHAQLLRMLGAADHQAATARVGELTGLELLLHAGGAGKGVTAIAQERRRQIAGERFAPDADLQYTQRELARAAACYALSAPLPEDGATVPCPPEWPWARCWWKPKGARANLVRAGALIAAELDRMDRAQVPAP